MNGKWTLPLAALAFSLTMTPFSAFAAPEEASPPSGEKVNSGELPPSGEKADSEKLPPSGERPRPGKRPSRRERERRVPGMSEEQWTQFKELNRKIEEALEAYRAEPNDSTKAALKERISERFDLWQKFAIERAEKVLAREKERLENKEQEVDRQLQRMLRPRKEKAPRN